MMLLACGSAVLYIFRTYAVARQAGGLEGCKPSKNRSFSPQQGDKVALLRRKKEIFGGGKPPPNSHRVSSDLVVGHLFCLSPFRVKREA